MYIRDKRKIILYLIFAVIFIIRLINITSPPLDYSSWRQVDTDSIARNFINYKFNIFYPQLNYDGPMPNYVQLEFQVTTFILALLYKYIGISYITGRMIPILFFMGSCVYLYRLVKMTSGMNVALISVFFYGILPLNVIYSRNIMPESALLFFTIGCVYYFWLWIQFDKSKYYLAALFFTTLAILTKLPAALIGIPLIFLAFSKYKIKVFKNLKLYVFAFFSLGVPWLYFLYTGAIAEQKFVYGIGGTMIIPNLFTSILERNTQEYLREQFITKVFTLPGVILFALGISIKKRKEEYFYYAWLLCAVLHIVLIDSTIHLDYYLIFLTPIIAVFIGYGARLLFTNKNYEYFFYMALIIIFLNNAVLFEEIHKVREDYIVIGNFVKSNSHEGDLIIIDRDSPELFYTSGRKGWRLYGELISKDNIETLISKGAAYFVVSSPEAAIKITGELDKIYTRMTGPSGFIMYKLEK
ncbi:dolichyl-phosphate-mannose-protein mannosyltransferase [Oxobacter pfennigii]|uniref:Dolichyl-phosphate-mannose-protein mannosyltransferase n=1 Tax=Oxobacter pfennigii TaxID=36849 RepID=A0A0P8W9E8_9CLOT|nr:glycosyltransferase family 39 protein [Oxobacter pfennigii]KPU44602.1 dolichyl-phosphate-mannose-protein mannosyltransferase [Oxobacter pfennigii]